MWPSDWWPFDGWHSARNSGSYFRWLCLSPWGLTDCPFSDHTFSASLTSWNEFSECTTWPLVVVEISVMPAPEWCFEPSSPLSLTFDDAIAWHRYLSQGRIGLHCHHLSILWADLGPLLSSCVCLMLSRHRPGSCGLPYSASAGWFRWWEARFWAALGSSKVEAVIGEIFNRILRDPWL